MSLGPIFYGMGVLSGRSPADSSPPPVTPCMPSRSMPSFEAWTTATALAASTERIRLGHLVLANGFRHPALLAKMAVTLDHASGGRLDLGLGSGSYPPEYRQLGLEFPSDRMRAERLDEALHVLKLLFTEDAPSFTGRHYRLDAAPSLPRPLQRPHPPIHVGGAGERRTLPLVARYAEVWNCRRTRWPSCRGSSTCCTPSARASVATPRRCG